MKILTLTSFILLFIACRKSSLESTKDDTVNKLTINSEDSLNQKYLPLVTDFIDYVKNNRKRQLAEKVVYPLRRQQPLPDIKNAEEFVERYDEVFDETLVKMIVDSHTVTDWSDVGSRGIMLNNGDLWIDYDGSIIGINYQSDFEIKDKEKKIEEVKKQLHPSLRAFKEPALVLETKSFKIRIDDMGNYKYRYASWSIDSSMKSKPFLVLENGVADDGGYTFKSGLYRYECFEMDIRGDDEPPALLWIYNGDKEILRQNAEVIRY